MPCKNFAVLKSIRPDTNFYLPGNPLAKKRDFIALRQALLGRIRGSTIAACQDRRLFSFLCKALRDPQYHRSFAGTSHRQVPNTDDRPGQPACFENAARITPKPQAHDGGIERGKRPKQLAQGGIAFHAGPRVLSITFAMYSNT